MKPSGLAVRENQRFHDSGHSYLLHPFYAPEVSLKYRLSAAMDGHFRPWELIRSKATADYTFGALFQQAAADASLGV